MAKPDQPPSAGSLMEDILADALAIQDRFVAEPMLKKTGRGVLKSRGNASLVMSSNACSGAVSRTRCRRRASSLAASCFGMGGVILVVAEWHRVGQSGYPLRTVRESFPSYGSSLSKDISYVACPGWFSFPEFKSIAVSIVKGSEMTNGKGVGDD